MTALTSLGSTSHWLAAARSSISRNAAPITRIDWMWWRMLREPSVSWLPYLTSSPGAWTIFTRAQSASISSAITIGRLVREPVPISERCATMVTVPSGAIETNTCGLVTTPFGMSSPPCG